MKVFVTGGTGFIGREVVRQLRGAGHDISCLVRDPNDPRARALAGREGARLAPGNLMDPASLTPLLRGHDAVIHLVGIISQTRKRTYESAHVRATAALVQAARSAGIRRWVQMSALGTRPDAASLYHQTKWRAEEEVRAGSFDLTVFRPSIVYGPEDLFVNLFAKMARWLPFIPVMGGGLGTFQPVPVETVAECFCRCLDQPFASGQTYDVGGREILTLVQIIDQILHVCGRKRLKLFIPVWAARPLAAFLEVVCGGILLMPPPLNRDQLIMLQEKTVGNVEPTLRAFDLHPPLFAKGIAYFLRRRSS